MGIFSRQCDEHAIADNVLSIKLVIITQNCILLQNMEAVHSLMVCLPSNLENGIKASAIYMYISLSKHSIRNCTWGPVWRSV